MPGLAQELISPEAFLDIAEGKTLTFERFDTGQQAGIEEYLSRDLSVWREPNGRCVYGDITVEDRQVCYVYRDAPHRKECWWAFREGDRLLVKSTRWRGQIQEVTEITEDTLSCPSVPMS